MLTVQQDSRPANSGISTALDGGVLSLDTYVPKPHRFQALDLMSKFASRTGLNTKTLPRRYLWTDAFAVCNYLALWHETQDHRFVEQAILLIDQVHQILGKHRRDDSRSGWLSGLDEQEALEHPTAGGLRIGKPRPERRPDQRPDPGGDWDRDGQYFHYLTQWMHALNQTSLVTGEPQYNRWAQELAIKAHDSFRYELPGSRRSCLAWKMSIDLSRPHVRSMGHHDALEGRIGCARILATAAYLSATVLDNLQDVETSFATMSAASGLATADPLGIGGLLCKAHRADQLRIGETRLPSGLVADLLQAALSGLRTFVARRELSAPATARLAFRELGLAIGLVALKHMDCQREPNHRRDERVPLLLSDLQPYFDLQQEIRTFWSNRAHRETRVWKNHQDINDVMLATTLLPSGYLA